MNPEALLEAYSSGQRDFKMIDLSSQAFDGEVLSRADFSGANLTETSFARANLYGAIFQKANLTKARLSGASLKNADLTQANLQQATLQFANFARANLTAADFSGADLRGADLSAVALDYFKQNTTNFASAIYDQSTLFPEGVDPVELGLTTTVETPTHSSGSKDAEAPSQSGALGELKNLYEASQAKNWQLKTKLQELMTTAQNYLNRQVTTSQELQQTTATNIGHAEDLEAMKLQLQAAQQELTELRQRKDQIYPSFPWVLTAFFLFYCYLGFLWTSRLSQLPNPGAISYTILVPEISVFLASWAGCLLSHSKKSPWGILAFLAAIATLPLPIVVNFGRLFSSVPDFFGIVFSVILFTIIDIIVYVFAVRQKWCKSASEYKLLRTLLCLTLAGLLAGTLAYLNRQAVLGV
jgi:uncharacterized protein YjbI with pentapeptide repeats